MGMATAALVITAIGGAIQVFSSYQQYEAQRKANRLAARQRRENASRMQQEIEAKRRENKRRLAGIRATYGRLGLAMAGSPMAVLQDSAANLERDALTLESKQRSMQLQGDLLAIEEKSKENAVLLGIASSAVNVGTDLLMPTPPRKPQ